MRFRLLTAVFAVAALGLTTACHKKVAAAPPPPPPMARQQAAVSPLAQRQQTPYQPQPARNERPAVPDAATRATIQDLLNRINDAYFDYNKHNIRPDAQAALAADAKTLAQILKQYPSYKLTVEGSCDERGSDEYNVALGDARAKEAKQYLATLGVPADQLKTVSLGKERPVCTEHDEACWQKNRRAHITQEQGS